MPISKTSWENMRTSWELVGTHMLLVGRPCSYEWLVLMPRGCSLDEVYVRPSCLMFFQAPLLEQVALGFRLASRNPNQLVQEGGS